jgi:glycosyltransferase involved in cell wall biosynthesis
MIRILHFTPKWASGGVEGFLMNLFRAVDREGLSFSLCVVWKTSCVDDAALAGMGIEFAVLTQDNRQGKFASLFSSYFRFYRLLRVSPFDIVHFHISNGAALFYVFLAKLAGVPVRIAHSHNTGIGGGCAAAKKIIHGLCKAVFSRSPTDYFACSTPAAQWLFTRRVFRQRQCVIIHNGINTVKYAFNESAREAYREQLGLGGRLVIGHIGQFNRQKNHQFLIEIFREVYSLDNRAVLLLVGDGELAGILRNAVHAMNLDDSVYFLGRRDDIPELLATMDVFAFPSIFEGFPLVLLEVQASGLNAVFSSSITAEVTVTDLACSMPLKKTAREWADFILSRNGGGQRAIYADQIGNAGFSILAVAGNMKIRYEDMATRIASATKPAILYNHEY